MANEISLSKQVSMVDNIVESVNEILSDAFIWLTFCDRDGTINIYDEELQELLEIIQELEELLVGAITGKLPEEASGPLSKMGAIFGGGTGLNLFTKSGKKIPFTISPEIIKEMEAVAKPIYEKYLGREVDLIKETLVQYNAYIEELNEGKIVLFSGNPAEREDYIGGNPRKSDPNLLVDLSHNPEARFGEETEVYDPKTNQTVKTNLQIVESTFLIPKELEPCRAEIEYELYKAINSIDGVKMPPFGPFDDRKNIRNDFRSRCYSV